MKVIVLACVFLVGVYCGLRAEEGGELEVAVETLASLVMNQASAW
jgi:hypothetical protein